MGSKFSPNDDHLSAPYYGLSMPENPPPYCPFPPMPMPGPVSGFNNDGPSSSSQLWQTQQNNASDENTLKEDNVNGKSEKILLHQSSKLQRTMFLRNVYAIFSCQALVVCGIIALLFYIPEFRSYFTGLSFFKFWPLWIIGTILACFVTTMYKLMRQPPVNLLLLTLVTLFVGVLLGTLAARLDEQEGILIGVAVVFCVCTFVVIFTFQDKRHFTPITSVCYVWVLLLIAFGILVASYSADFKKSATLMIGPVAFCTYIVVTTQLLVKNEQKSLFSNEFVYGAVQISMYLLAVFAKVVYKIFSKICCCCNCCFDGCDNLCDDL